MCILPSCSSTYQNSGAGKLSCLSHKRGRKIRMAGSLVFTCCAQNRIRLFILRTIDTVEDFWIRKGTSEEILHPLSRQDININIL